MDNILELLRKQPIILQFIIVEFILIVLPACTGIFIAKMVMREHD